MGENAPGMTGTPRSCAASMSSFLYTGLTTYRAPASTARCTPAAFSTEPTPISTSLMLPATFVIACKAPGVVMVISMA